MSEDRKIECVGKKRLRQMLGDASDSTIWRWVKDGRLPPPRQIGPNRVAWFLHELEETILAFPVAECKTVAPGSKRGRKPRTTTGKEVLRG
jgi:predicted DNA-binding transcriptional regulator AlpA